jgi:hypothetical protein
MSRHVRSPGCRPCHRGGSQLLGLGVSPGQGPRPYTSPAFIGMKAASSPVVSVTLFLRVAVHHHAEGGQPPDADRRGPIGTAAGSHGSAGPGGPLSGLLNLTALWETGGRDVGFSRSGQALLRLVRRQKLGIDPALHAGVLDLDPVPLPACSCELRATGGSPQNGRVSGGCRPDVYAGTLQKDEIRGRHSTWSNLGRTLGGEGSGNIG